MATPVIMPRQGQSVESCIFSEWYVKTGDKVKKGDLLFAYETDKAAFEGESPEDGILLEVFAEPGDAIQVLENIGVIGEPGEETDQFRPGNTAGGDAVIGSAKAGAGVREAEIPTGAGGQEAGTLAGMGIAGTKAGTENTGTGTGTRMSEAGTGKVSTESGTGNLIDPNETGPVSGTKMMADHSPLSQQAGTTAAETNLASASGEIRISPRARKAAENLHINYSGIKGSGPEGRIIEKDILNKSKDLPKSTPLARAISYQNHVDLPYKGSGPGGKVIAEDVKHSGPADLSSGFEDRKISNIRRIIAENMHASLQNTAQLTLHASADARKIKLLRSRLKKEAEQGIIPNITINDLVCYATVIALSQHPEVNVHFLGDSIRHFRDIHLGFAVDTQRGLMVPTLRNANHLKLEGFAIQMKDLAAQAQSGKIDPELLTGATFTITNLGAFGIEMFTPVLNPPQIAILGLNTITMHPSQLEDGSFGFIPKIGLSLTFDHRAIDGAPAAAFLRDIIKEIENFEII